MRQMEVQNEAAVAYLQKINWDGVAEGGLNLAGKEFLLLLLVSAGWLLSHVWMLIWSVVSERGWLVVVERGGSVVWMILDLIVAELGHEWLQIYTHLFLE